MTKKKPIGKAPKPGTPDVPHVPDPTIGQILNDLQDKERDQAVQEKEMRGGDAVIIEDLAVLGQGLADEALGKQGLEKAADEEQQ